MLKEKIKAKILDWIISVLSNNKILFENLLSKNRNRLISEYINYPSIINSGYLHIEQVFNLTTLLSLNVRKGLVVDVGAADGQISLMFEQHFVNSEIYSFEPVKSTFDELVENVKEKKHIRPCNLALGSKKKQLSINKTSRITSSSLFGITTNIIDSYFAENIFKVGEEMVNISSLDDEIPHEAFINLIKIDVQGFELEVLKGGVSTLSRTSVVIVEVQNHNLYIEAPKYYDIDNFLRQNDFILYNIIPSLRKNMKLYEWDAIYLNKKHDKNFNN